MFMIHMPHSFHVGDRADVRLAADVRGGSPRSAVA